MFDNINMVDPLDRKRDTAQRVLNELLRSHLNPTLNVSPMVPVAMIVGTEIGMPNVISTRDFPELIRETNRSRLSSSIRELLNTLDAISD
ncbi:hypothetical protein NBRC116583_34830 [Arenicella sp. 4NH20-0111]|uniref:hypothetical protein n=1 Tax=Arenicella sp. 4NH20-0111 TaxID=3127648 RepID=UPI00310A83FF